jgi:putative endonuclease
VEPAFVKQFYVYLLASNSRTLYVGVTNDLLRRLWQHRNGEGSQFAARYQVARLVYYETTENSYAAIAREKQIKGYRRDKKIALIELNNGSWDDLSIDWFRRG